MIILHRVTPSGGEAPTGVPLHNIAACGEARDGKTWVSYWGGEKLMKMAVTENLEQVQHLVFISRHGKRPAKGVLGDLK